MRRWKRRLLWTALLLVAALLAVPATVSQAAGALRHARGRAPMRRLIPIVGLVALGAAVGSGTLASASSTHPAASTLTLIAIDIPKSEISVDAGAKGGGPGDTVFFRETLLRNGRKAGGSEVMCVFVSRNSGRCSGTLRVGGGTLEATGGTRFGGRFSLPVVGGTGVYAGAKGVLTVVAVSEKRSRYEIDLAE